MCIRDRVKANPHQKAELQLEAHLLANLFSSFEKERIFSRCLLYTSDAADERSSVDLGGRRIIKKKKKRNLGGMKTRRKK